MDEETKIVEPEAKVEPSSQQETLPPPPTDWEARYKGVERERGKLQGRNAKLEDETRSFAAVRQEIASLRQDISLITRVLSEAPETNELDWEARDETPKPKTSRKEVIEKLRSEVSREVQERQAQAQALENYLSQVKTYISKKAQSIELDLEDPKFSKSLELYQEAVGKMHQGDANWITEMQKATDEADNVVSAEFKALKGAKEKETETKMGLLKVDTGKGGASSTFAQIEEAYADGKVDYMTYKKARQERGLS